MKLLLPLLLACALNAAAAPWTGPYRDVSLSPTDLPAPPWLAAPAPGRVLIWAFAGGDCRAETWGEGVDAAALARDGVAAMVARGQDYLISTGGQAAGFDCDSGEALLALLARYDSPHLVGLDFDIERDQRPAQIDALVRAAAAVHRQRPALRLMFTLATHGVHGVMGPWGQVLPFAPRPFCCPCSCDERSSVTLNRPLPVQRCLGMKAGPAGDEAQRMSDFPAPVRLHITSTP